MFALLQLALHKYLPSYEKNPLVDLFTFGFSTMDAMSGKVTLVNSTADFQSHLDTAKASSSGVCSSFGF